MQPGVSVKPYPCGSLAHPAMDALLALVKEYDVRPQDVAEVRLGTSSNVLAALRYDRPQNALEARFSIPFCLAVLVVDCHAGIAQFQDTVVRRPDIVQMMDCVKKYLHPEIEARGYDRIRSLVEVQLQDGRVLAREADAARGTPQRPLSRQELAAKFSDCARLLLPEERIGPVLAAIDVLEEAEDINQLALLLR